MSSASAASVVLWILGVAIVLAALRALFDFGPRDSTQYVVGPDGKLVRRPSTPAMDAGDAPAASASTLGEPDAVVEGAETEQCLVEDEARDSAGALEEVYDQWGELRAVCPCCGYPTGGEYDEFVSCVLCEWEEPLAPQPGWEVTPSTRVRALEQARANWARHGSAVSPVERAQWEGVITAREREIRVALREEYDALKHRDHPDLAERWDRIDILIQELRTEQARAQEEREREDPDLR